VAEKEEAFASVIKGDIKGALGGGGRRSEGLMGSCGHDLDE